MSVLDRLDALDHQVRAKPWPTIAVGLGIGFLIGVAVGLLL